MEELNLKPIRLGFVWMCDSFLFNLVPLNEYAQKKPTKIESYTRKPMCNSLKITAPCEWENNRFSLRSRNIFCPALAVRTKRNYSASEVLFGGISQI